MFMQQVRPFCDLYVLRLPPLFPPKSTDWKVMVAGALKRHTSAPNTWIAGELNMGVPQAVSMYVGKFRMAKGEASEPYQKIIQRITE